MEHRLFQKENELSEPKEKLLIIERILDKITIQLSSTINSINSLISEFKITQKKNGDNADTLEQEVNVISSLEKVGILEKIISEKNNKIIKLKEGIEQRDFQIEIDKNDINQTIIHKDKAIFKLIIDLEAKINQLNEQNMKIKELEVVNSLIQVSPKIIREIKKYMKYKGFITEHEFQEIIDYIFKPKMLF